MLGTGLSVFAELKIVSATGAQTANATLGVSQLWNAVVATYKGALFPVELQRFRAE